MIAAALAGTTVLISPSSAQTAPAPRVVPDRLEADFRDPPASARPRVWWHWMNGNITEDGIAKDLAWMKRVGIAGAQTFDANLATPQIVDKRLIYMTPDWKHAFRFAATRARDLDLELAIAGSPAGPKRAGRGLRPRAA